MIRGNFVAKEIILFYPQKFFLELIVELTKIVGFYFLQSEKDVSTYEQQNDHQYDYLVLLFPCTQVLEKMRYQRYHPKLFLFFFFFFLQSRIQADKDSLLNREEMDINADDNIAIVLQKTSKIVLNGGGKQCMYLSNKLDLPQFYFRRCTKSVFPLLYNQAVPTDLNTFVCVPFSLLKLLPDRCFKFHGVINVSDSLVFISENKLGKTVRNHFTEVYCTPSNRCSPLGQVVPFQC